MCVWACRSLPGQSFSALVVFMQPTCKDVGGASTASDLSHHHAQQRTENSNGVLVDKPAYGYINLYRGEVVVTQDGIGRGECSAPSGVGRAWHGNINDTCTRMHSAGQYPEPRAGV